MIGVLKSAWTFGSRWKEVQFWDVFGPFVSGKILSGHALHLHWIAGAGVALLVEGVLWWIGRRLSGKCIARDYSRSLAVSTAAEIDVF